LPNYSVAHKSINYLEEFKEWRQSHPHHTPKNNEIDWSIWWVADKSERMKMIKHKAQYIEDRAMNWEKIIKQKQNGGTINDTIEVNDMLVESIKAKLAILDDL